MEIGKSYSITAKAAARFKFNDWTSSQTNTNATLTFLMSSNLTFTANFVDDTPPTLVINSPKSGQNMSNALFIAIGTVKDNVGVVSASYQLNGGPWTPALPFNNWTNWNAVLNLSPGTNTFKAYASDAAGNNSTTQSVNLFYAVTTPLIVSTNGHGTVSPNYNNAMLEIGKSYSMKATASTGFKFTGWTGGQTTTNATLTLLMTSNLTLTANFADDSVPTLAITAPKSGLNVSNAAFTVTGTAKDNVGVASVFYQLNGGDWLPATTSNAWANWSTGVTLIPGANTIKAYALDGKNNSSVIESGSCFYVLSAVLTVNTNGHGTVSPNDSGALLEIGKSYTIKATASSGFKFTGWTGGTNSTNATLTFSMSSNLTFTANFMDAIPPTVTITSPTSGQHISNATFLVMGKASDNVGVASVFYNLNAGGWNPAQTVNSWTNWMIGVTPTPGTNTVQAYSVDAAGNVSPTESAAFDYVVPPDWAPDSLSGQTATVTPDGQNTIIVSFGDSTFSQSQSLADTNVDSGVGNYTYVKLSTNTAQLSFTFTAPPLYGDDTNVVNLTFNALNSGTFSNQDMGGAISVSSAANLVPASLSGKTLNATSIPSGDITKLVLSGGTFTQTDSPSNKSSAGNYTFQQFSPVSAMVTDLELHQSHQQIGGHHLCGAYLFYHRQRGRLCHVVR